MGDTKTDFLAATKLLLGINNDESDSLISLMIDEVTDATLSYCRLDVLPRQLESFIPTLAAKRYGLSMQGGVKSVTEGDRRIEYGEEDYDFLSSYKSRLRPFMNVGARVPTDLDAKEALNDKSF